MQHSSLSYYATKLSRVQHSLEGCDSRGEGWDILYFKASVVQWKDIRLWRPEFGPEEKYLFLELVYCVLSALYTSSSFAQQLVIFWG